MANMVEWKNVKDLMESKEMVYVEGAMYPMSTFAVPLTKVEYNPDTDEFVEEVSAYEMQDFPCRRALSQLGMSLEKWCMLAEQVVKQANGNMFAMA